MRVLSGDDLLDVWEMGERKLPWHRGWLILASAFPTRSWRDLLRMTVGERNRLLFELREKMIGPDVEAIVGCPRCEIRLEFRLDSREIRQAVPVDAQQTLEITVGDCLVRFRTPRGEDLEHVTQYSDQEMAAAALRTLCVSEVYCEGRWLALNEFPPQIWEAVSGKLREVEPLSALRLDSACPECGHEWSISLDIAAFFYKELATRAQRLLEDVHALARAYGWAESDILAMSAVRRNHYLEMLS